MFIIHSQTRSSLEEPLQTLQGSDRSYSTEPSPEGLQQTSLIFKEDQFTGQQ